MNTIFKDFDAAILFHVRLGFIASIHATLVFNDTIRKLKQGLKSRTDQFSTLWGIKEFWIIWLGTVLSIMAFSCYFDTNLTLDK